MDNELLVPLCQDYSINMENMTFRLLLNTHENIIIEEQVDILKRNALHTHNFAELFACLSGQITILTADNEISLQAGDMALIPVGLPHVKIPSDPESEWYAISYLCIKRRVRCTQDLYIQMHNLCYGEHPLIFRQKPALCMDAAKVTASITNGVNSILLLQTTTILLQLRQIKPESGKKAYNSDNIRNIDMYRLSVIEYIYTTEFMKDIGIPYMAKLLFISKRQFERIASKRFGMTWHQALMQKRVELACKLLTETDLSAEKIGMQVGFKSKSALYREFQRHSGMSPMQYRHTHG